MFLHPNSTVIVGGNEFEYQATDDLEEKNT